MAWFLFIDESGHDRSTSPYEVLAGVAIQDQAVRDVIDRLHQAEIQSFGRRYRATRERLGNPDFEIWSFAHISDLRTQAERAEA